MKAKPVEIVEGVLFMLLIAAVFTFGFLRAGTGFEVVINSTYGSFAFGVVDAVLTSFIFTIFIVISSVGFFYRLRKQKNLDGGTGTITAIIPVYRDAEALERSVSSVADSDYEDVETVVVCEPDDEASIEEAERLSEEYGIDYLVNEKYTGSKAGAVNYAAEETDSEYVAVLDADELIDEKFFSVAAGKMESYDVVQGRTIPEPEGIVESLAYYESVFLSYVSPRLLYVLTDFRIAASRSTVIDRNVFEEVEGYSEEMLTEDFHFSFKCYRNRLDVYELLEYPSKIEAAHTLKDWWGQRKRWMIGYVQTISRLLREVRFVDRRSLASGFIGISTLLGSVLLISMLSKFIFLVVMDAEFLALMPVAAIFGSLAYFHDRDLRYGIQRPGIMLLLSPFVLPFYSLAALKALIEFFGSWRGEWYSVKKSGEGTA